MFISFRLIYFMKIFNPLFIVIIFISCNNKNNGNIGNEVKHKFDSKNTPNYEITITKSHAVKDDSVNFLGYMGDFSVDQNGHVYVMSGGSRGLQQIFVYGSEGQLMDKIGGKGRGPAEFQVMANIDIRLDTLYVYDNILQRFSLFSTESLELIDTIIPEQQAIKQPDSGIFYELSSEFYPMENGNIILRAEENYIVRAIKQGKDDGPPAGEANHYYYLMDDEGNLTSEPVYTGVDNRFGKAGPYKKIEADLPHTLNYGVTYGPEGKIYSTPSDSLMIRIEEIWSGKQRSIQFAYDNAELNPERIIDHYEDYPAMKEIAESADLPDTWPAVNRFIVDDVGRIWVSVITSDYNNYDWWVIGQDGELLATFNWEGNKLDRGLETVQESILEIKNNKIYAYEIDDGAVVTGNIAVYDFTLERIE